MKKLSFLFTLLLWLPAHANDTELSSFFGVHLTERNIFILTICILLASTIIYICLQKSWNESFSKLIASIVFPATLSILILFVTGIIEDISKIKDSSIKVQEDISKIKDSSIKIQEVLLESKGFYKGLEFYHEEKYDEAFTIWKPLAKSGNKRAQNNLAVMYKNGEWVNKDFEEAINLFHQSADQGHAEAQYNLGTMYLYYEHENVDKNSREAFMWINKAARQGHAEAQYNLAVMYENQKQAYRSNIKAYMWYYIARDNGNGKAENGIKFFKRAIHSAEIAEAEEMAKRCIESEYEDCGEE